MKNWKLIITGFLLFTFSAISAQNKDLTSLFIDGNEAFKNENYQEALKNYNEIALSGNQSFQLYYNIGNCYYKLNDYTKAILFYEKAKKFNPSDPDLLMNLKLANTKITDKVDALPEFVLYTMWKNIVNANSSNGWAWLALQTMLLSFLIFGFYIVTHKSSLKKLSFYSASVLLIISSLFYVFAYQNKQHYTQNKFAIVIEESLNVYNQPAENGTKLFVIHEGLKVEGLEEMENWVKIKLSDGKTGWIKKDYLTYI